MNNSKIFKNMEWWILIFAVILCIIGFVALYSTTYSDGLDDFKKQIVWFIIGIIAMTIVTFIDYKVLTKISPILYGITIVLLIAVLFTNAINGASSWFQIESLSLQPGEIAKVAVVLFLAYVVTKIQSRGKEEINRPTRLLVVIAVVAFPTLLILLQPDIGTAATYLVVLVVVLFVAGIDKRYIIVAVVLVIVTAPLIYNFILPEHAKTRIDVFLNPESDPRGAGYNVLQSELAIGAGELTGMGLLNGNQTQLGYLSPKTTDFIFSAIGEEMGFIVAGSLIIVYVLLITKSLYVAKTAKDDCGTYIAAGISAIFIFHMTENIGMTMGVLPITGVPLLFVSYGGSSLLMSFICIGLLLNISGNRKKTIFVR